LSIHGQCQCGNIKTKWNCIDYSMSPRACQCDYCSNKQAAYVSKPGSLFELSIIDKQHHHKVKQGSETATFHECSYCNSLIAVTVEIDQILYGILNAKFLNNKIEFADAIETNFDGQSIEEKRQRWQRNWCRAKIT
jgi:hypothetical protein